MVIKKMGTGIETSLGCNFGFNKAWIPVVNLIMHLMILKAGYICTNMDQEKTYVRASPTA